MPALRWLETHDRGCDLVYGMLDLVVRHLGERRIGPLWDELMAPMYETYDVYDTATHPWPRSMHRLIVIAALSLRGHLSGPGRMGADRDRRGGGPLGAELRSPAAPADAPIGTRTPEGPRMVPPFEFAVTTEAHDWAWGKKGVCVYCVHCCQLNQRMPIRRFGYPTRVIDPPTWPQARSGRRLPLVGLQGSLAGAGGGLHHRGLRKAGAGARGSRDMSGP